MNDSALKFRIGLLVAGSLLLLAVLAVMFGSLPLLFKPHHRYTVILPTAPGVGPGTPVLRSGVRIGQVESVDLDDETGKVRVGIVVERRHTLRHNEQPVLNRGLLGESNIEFVTKPPEKGQLADNTPIEPGSEIVGITQTDAQALLNQAARTMPSMVEALDELGRAAQAFNRTAPQIDEAVREIRDLSRATNEMLPELRKSNSEAIITLKNWGAVGERTNLLLAENEKKVSKTLDDLDDTLTRIGRAFNDENQKNLNIALKNVRQSSESLDSVTKNTDELIKESRKTMERVNGQLTRTDDVLQNMQRATKPMADRSEVVMRNLDESSVKLSRTLDDVQELLRAFARSDGTIQKLMTDPSLYNNLNEMTCLFLHAMPRIDRMLRDLEVFTDKIARHPEALGVGGAVRPGSGLK